MSRFLTDLISNRRDRQARRSTGDRRTQYRTTDDQIPVTTLSHTARHKQPGGCRELRIYTNTAETQSQGVCRHALPCPSPTRTQAPNRPTTAQVVPHMFAVRERTPASSGDDSTARINSSRPCLRTPRRQLVSREASAKPSRRASEGVTNPTPRSPLWRDPSLPQFPR